MQQLWSLMKEYHDLTFVLVMTPVLVVLFFVLRWRDKVLNTKALEEGLRRLEDQRANQMKAGEFFDVFFGFPGPIVLKWDNPQENAQIVSRIVKAVSSEDGIDVTDETIAWVMQVFFAATRFSGCSVLCCGQFGSSMLEFERDDVPGNIAALRHGVERALEKDRVPQI